MKITAHNRVKSEFPVPITGLTSRDMNDVPFGGYLELSRSDLPLDHVRVYRGHRYHVVSGAYEMLDLDVLTRVWTRRRTVSFSSADAWAVFFDRAVHTPARLLEEAAKMRDRFGPGLASVSEWSLLDNLISAVAARYNGRTAWDIRTRRGDALLADASLGDAPVGAA